MFSAAEVEAANPKVKVSLFKTLCFSFSRGVCSGLLFSKGLHWFIVSSTHGHLQNYHEYREEDLNKNNQK